MVGRFFEQGLGKNLADVFLAEIEAYFTLSALTSLCYLELNSKQAKYLRILILYSWILHILQMYVCVCIPHEVLKNTIKLFFCH